MVMRGGGASLDANFVSDSAVVRPAMPPPSMVMRSGLVFAILEGL